MIASDAGWEFDPLSGADAALGRLSERRSVELHYVAACHRLPTCAIADAGKRPYVMRLFVVPMNSCPSATIADGK
jgi:hypothetical protein